MVAIRKETPRPERLCFNRHPDHWTGILYGWFSFSYYFFFFYLFIFLSCRPRLECMALASVAVSIVIERLSSDGFRLTNEKYSCVQQYFDLFNKKSLNLNGGNYDNFSKIIMYITIAV